MVLAKSMEEIIYWTNAVASTSSLLEDHYDIIKDAVECHIRRKGSMFADPNKIHDNVSSLIATLRKDRGLSSVLQSVKLDAVDMIKKVGNAKQKNALPFDLPMSSKSPVLKTPVVENQEGVSNEGLPRPIEYWRIDNIFTREFLDSAAVQFPNQPIESAAMQALDFTLGTEKSSKTDVADFTELIVDVSDRITQRVLDQIKPENFGKALFSQLNSELQIIKTLREELIAMKNATAIGVQKAQIQEPKYSLPTPVQMVNTPTSFIAKGKVLDQDDF